MNCEVSCKYFLFYFKSNINLNYRTIKSAKLLKEKCINYIMLVTYVVSCAYFRVDVTGSASVTTISACYWPTYGEIY